jgi:hypothetical protein
MLPVEIGLTKCFGELCRKHHELNHFLAPKTHPNLLPSSIPAPVAKADNTKESIFGKLIPKKVRSGVGGEVKAEEHSLRTFLLPFKIAAIVMILCMSIATFINLMLILIILHKILPSFVEVSMLSQNMLLVAAVAAMFLGTMLYLLLTCSHLNGGHYVDGVWITCYACLVGLCCSVASAIMPQPVLAAAGYGPIPDASSYSNFSPVQPVSSTGDMEMTATVHVSESRVRFQAP